MKISFEKDTPEEKQAKKEQKRAKRKERYGHLTEAEEGSLATYLGTLFKKDKEGRKKFLEVDNDASHLTEAEEGSAVKYTQDLFKKMFPEKEEKQRRKSDKKKQKKAHNQDNDQDSHNS